MYISLDSLKEVRFISNLCILYIFLIDKYYRPSFCAISEYWKYVIALVEASKKLRIFIFDKFEDSTSSKSSLKDPTPNKLSSKSPTLLQRFIQKNSGYKGLRFICTADETHMSSSITFVVSGEIFDVFYDGQEKFEGTYEFEIFLVLKFWYQ